jgi:PIN domain nuclease of toxin-antitoxin system
VTVLLDTVAFVRYSQDQLPPNVQRVLQKPSTEVLVSIITPWEISLKPLLTKFGMTSTRVREGIDALCARVLPITLDHTEKFSQLPRYHDDPFDRMLISQALVENCSIISSDQRFPLYAREGLKTIWQK